MRPLLIAAIFLVTAAAGYGESITETENPPPLESLVCGTFFAYDERSGSYIYNVNIDTYDITPLVYIEGFQVDGCCLSEDEKYLVIHGYYFDTGLVALIVMEVRIDKREYRTELVFEERFDQGSIITSVYEKRETCFYIAVAKPGWLSTPIEGSYEAYFRDTGKTGDTVVYKYTPGSAILAPVTTLLYYSKIDALDPDDHERLYLVYEEYPYAKRLGLLNTRNGSVSPIYPIPDYRFFFFHTPDAVSKDCLKDPASYYCIPAFNGHSDNMIVYVHYFASTGGDSIIKIGDAILLPVLFSLSREELVFLTYENGETVLRNYPLKESTSEKAIRLTRDLGSTFRLLHVE